MDGQERIHWRIFAFGALYPLALCMKRAHEPNADVRTANMLLPSHHSGQEPHNARDGRKWCRTSIGESACIGKPSQCSVNGSQQCLANIFQGLWSVFWILRFFLVSEIFLLSAGFTMLTVWMTLLRYPASLKHPIDWLFVHVPVRMFLLFLVNLAIWQNGLIALKWVILKRTT